MTIMKKAIRKGDATTHGGTVLEGSDSFPVMGEAAACMGHMVSCPKCQGTYPIIEGSGNMPVDGTFIAVEGMKTACGAELIASQDVFTIEHTIGEFLNFSDTNAEQKSVLVASLGDKFGGVGWRLAEMTEIVIMTNMYKSDIVGNHAGMLIDPSDRQKALLYDPSGSYCAGKPRRINGQLVHRPRIDIFYKSEVNIDDYVAYQKEDETPEQTLMVELWRFTVTKDNGDIIRNRVEQRDTNGLAKCATRVAQAIEGIGPFKDLESAIMYNTPVELRMSMMMLKQLGR